MSQKVLVTGANGQLGRELVEFFSEDLNYEVFGYGRKELDITNQEQVEKLFWEIQPDIVVHSAAYTKVDLAETDVDTAYEINSVGTRNIAVAAENIGSKLVYISTDYVFDGTGVEPYNEFMRTSPIGVYGKTKLAGEELVSSFHKKYFIVRTSWVYGKHGSNFVKTMLKIADEKDNLSVVDDQIGCPTYTFDLVACISDLIKTSKYGVYHVSNSGSCSWFEFAKAIFEEAGIKVKLNPCTSKEFPRPAPRPAFSVFDHMSLRLNGFQPMRHWKEALAEFIENNK
ncbi:dTDP-4-dehydrorhamnose reductase [Fictibacillus norfolkensis]|uniref:dTDP-4-dehydrorhamnose reductase n=1 Tax=Fictibacillus norfolkensis TaxID=2762233 RepID=A0ABR8SI46_9BACL|nr:dTDP-4-dehydrorhamnose reductase [Fictibacillus norfolkensis]MBD7963174.1 dTDP-4-dehydrorhamnose reductase [Fictibacillus norfolkensis]